ncbi:TPA: phage tail sheath family protein [Clostridioides difficile]|nr:phage tail sheath family protein [Clostridioides difficile]
MATGTWNEKEKKEIPGFYNRFKTQAEKSTNTGLKGRLAMPIRANWGEVGKVVTIKNDLRQLKTLFGDDMNYSAFKLGKLALLGNVKELLLYRLVDGNQKKGTLTLKDTTENSAKDVIKLETKYPTARNFNVTIKSNLVDSDKKDFIFFENTKQLFSSSIKGTIDEIVLEINSNLDNEYVIATKVADSDTALANLVNVALEGGNDGCTSITNESYLKALEEFERYSFDSFVLDGVADEALQETTKAWVAKNKELGKDILLFLGGKTEDNIKQINDKSKGFNDENIVNIGSSAYYENIKYTPSEVAVYIAALSASKGITGSICNAKTIFEEVEPRLSQSEVKECLKSGTLILDFDDGDVTIVDDVNTFKKYVDDKNEAIGYISNIMFINTINKDTSLKRKEFVGKIFNDSTGQTTVICALKKYFEELMSQGIISEFNVDIDTELQATAKADEFYWKWDAIKVDVMKKIYGTGYLG